MDRNGYVPPRPDAERKRRAQRVPAVPSRVMDAAAQTPRRDTAASSNQTQQAAPMNQQYAGRTNRRETNPAQGYQQPVQPRYPNNYYAPQQRTNVQPMQAQQPAYPPQQEQGYGNQRYAHQGGNPGYAPQQPQQPARDMYGNAMGYPAQGYYQQTPPQKQGGGNGQPPRKGGMKKVWLGLAAVIVVAGIGVGGYFGIKHQNVANAVNAYNNVFCEGVYVDGIDLGGMTAEEGVAAVQAKAQERNSSWSVKLTFGGQLVTEITADQLGMTVDIMDVMSQAWSQGHTGDLYERKAAMDALAEMPYEAYTAMPSGNTSVMDGILQDIKNNVYRAAQDAQLVSFDPSLDYPFTFQEEVAGRYLDTAPLKEKLYQMVSTMESGEVEIVPDVIQPNVTVADLKQHLALRGTASTPISSKSTEDRTNNIRRCFELISGTIVKPGEKFSFNKVVGERSVKNGFYEAVEYAYGTEVMGVGGGSCQASTTVYQAAVVAGLTIVDREPHSKEVSYAAYGQDATVYWSSGRKIDLVFKNNTDHDLYIVASVEQDPSNKKRLVATTTIYGDDLGNVRYELQSKVIKEIEAPTEPEYVKDKKQTYVTYTDQEYQVSKARKGYEVESYRVTYENEVATSRELLYTDVYAAKAARIYVGTKKRTE